MSSGPSNAAERPVLILGARGMLGTAWTRLLTNLGRPFITPGRDVMDLTRPETTSALAELEPSAVINCAGYTRVDDAEREHDLALQINAIGPGLLAAACGALDIPMVHYSTDYIFDGKATSPYAPDAPTGPLNVYGRTKLQGEHLIAATGAKCLIIRTSWLYAPWGNNFVRTIAAKSRENPSLRVVHDQRGRPTSAEHLADASFRLLRQHRTGIMHVCDEGECTWFEFAREIIRLSGALCPVEPCATSDFPRPATRPAYSVLCLDQTREALGPLPHWTENLRKAIDAMNAAPTERSTT